MRVLIACESSGTVREAFRLLGHDAWSADLLPADDGSRFHLQGDVLEVLGNGWDLMIGHPPCTYLSVSGMHWTTRGLRDPKLTEDALCVVRSLLNAPIPHIAIENPVSIISTRIRKPDQVIQPWQFGEDASKKTCLWLNNLQPLIPTRVLRGRAVITPSGKLIERWSNQTDSGQNKLGPSVDRWKQRSKTYSGIAKPMAQHWGSNNRRQLTFDL